MSANTKTTHTHTHALCLPGPDAHSHISGIPRVADHKDGCARMAVMTVHTQANAPLQTTRLIPSTCHTIPRDTGTAGPSINPQLNACDPDRGQAPEGGAVQGNQNNTHLLFIVCFHLFSLFTCFYYYQSLFQYIFYGLVHIKDVCVCFRSDRKTRR